MFDPFKKLKLASAFLGVESPAVVSDLDIAELFGRLSPKDLRGMTLQADKMLEQPGVRALHESRYMPQPEPLDRLSDLGDGTLGYEYARYLRQNKLSAPQLAQNLDLGDAGVYLSQRVRMTHPILHVITEYDASPLGELALQAYYVGQLDNLISGVIISSVLLQITRDSPDLLGPALEVTAEAYQRGKAARTFLGIAWEELWSAQVPQLRELIEIPPRSSAVAHLRTEGSVPVPSPRPTSTPSPSASTYGEDGFAALGRAASAASATAANNRSFSGYGSTSSSSSSSQSSPAPSSSKPARAPDPPSKLLASFMALAEQEAAKPTPPPTPEPPPREARPAAKPEPPLQPVKPPPPPARQPPPEPGYKIEETAKNITPALSPDDPDYF